MNKKILIVVAVLAIVAALGAVAVVSEQTKDVPTITAIEFSYAHPDTGKVYESIYFITMMIDADRSEDRYMDLYELPLLKVYYKSLYLGKVASTDKGCRFYSGHPASVEYDFGSIYKWHYDYPDGVYVELIKTGERVPLKDIRWTLDDETFPSSWQSKMSKNCKIEVV